MRTQFGPIFPHFANLGIGKNIVIISIGLMAIRIIIMLDKTTHIGKISTGRPESMDNERMPVPQILPASDTEILGAVFGRPGQGKEVVIVDDLFAWGEGTG